MIIDCYNEMYYTLSIPGCGLYRGLFLVIKYLSLAFISNFSIRCTISFFFVVVVVNTDSLAENPREAE